MTRISSSRPEWTHGRRAAVTLAVAGVVAVLVAGLAAGLVPQPSPSTGPGSLRVTSDETVVLPPAGADWDYQIGGVREPPPDVVIVSRDRKDATAGLYDICYVNAFQTQTDEMRFWHRRANRSLLLRRDGEPVVDGAWGEQLLDTRTQRKRSRLAEIVARWMQGCKEAGAEAVELDNLDSWTRSKGLLTKRDNARYARLLTAAADSVQLAAAQKNTPQLRSGPAIGFDFAIAEECGRWDECERYTDLYGPLVLDVEYSTAAFEKTCTEWSEVLPVILRDTDVTPGGPYDRC